MISQFDKGCAFEIYRAAFLAAPGDEDERDQAGFAAIEAWFPELGVHDQLDLLQWAQGSMDAEMVGDRRAA